LCQGAENDKCLTAPQVAALKKIYAGPQNSKGETVYPGYSPGGESGFSGWPLWITGTGAGNKSLQFGFGTQLFMDMVYSDPQWDPKKFDVDHDMKVADDRVGPKLNALNPDLKKFKDRGGKLILYHGWSDAAIPPMATIQYYQNVVSKMGAKNAAQFVELYMAPGMQHCGGGPGPDSFGQATVAHADPSEDMSASLEKWVESGVAPKQIVAAKYKSGTNPASGVVRTRPLCPYPQVAKYKGSGSTDDAANFTCAAP
jgi:Tannase and feruloyl esterase